MASWERRVHVATACDVRRRLGHARGEVMLFDALKGGAGSRRRLGAALSADKETGAETVVDVDDASLMIHRRDGLGWHGRRLSLDAHLPSTVQARMVGRRLGEVIADTGADHLLVTSVSDGRRGTMIDVEGHVQKAVDLDVRPLVRWLGPIRRGLHLASDEWRAMAKGHGTGAKDRLVDATRLAVGVGVPFVCVAQASVFGSHGDGARVAILLTPFVAYMTTGMGLGLWRDAAKRRAARRAPQS